jgi:flagellar operon protein
MDPITLARISGGAATPLSPQKSRAAQPPGSHPPGFDEALRARLEPPLRFSAHASARLQSRGIQLTADDKRALSAGIDAAAAKGARDAVLIQDDRAFVVNVPNRVVITAHTGAENRARVYSGIDAAVLL